LIKFCKSSRTIAVQSTPSGKSSFSIYIRNCPVQIIGQGMELFESGKVLIWTKTLMLNST
jgi:hypothetical protein